MDSNEGPTSRPPQSPDSQDSQDSSGPTTATATHKLDLNAPCRIVNVNFEGVHRTRTNVLARIVSGIFSARSVLEFLQKSVQIKENLTSLNAFSSVDIQVEPVGDDNNEDYEVTFVVKERGRITSSVYTAVDSHSTHLNLQLALPNLYGYGDTIQLSTKFNKRFYSGECRFSVPLSPWRSLWSPKYSIAYSQYQWEHMPSGFDQEDKSVTNQLEFYSRPQLQHVVSFDNIWRYIKSSSVQTPIEIREQCGHSIKSALRHTVTWDDRIGGNFPYAGIMASLTNEITTNLVTNGAKLTRHEFNVQLNTLILPKYDLLCQFNLLGGTLLRPSKINICDRFFAGGPLLVRGFNLHGIGPNVRGFPLGDMSFLSAGVHIYSILPGTSPDSPINSVIRPHFFVNAATIGDWRDSVFSRLRSRDDLRRETMRFRDSLRYSCGLGLVMHFARLRLELNYCLPLVFKEGDSTVRGLQWGFGMTYT